MVQLYSLYKDEVQKNNKILNFQVFRTFIFPECMVSDE